jgi:hypothetical protein
MIRSSRCMIEVGFIGVEDAHLLQPANLKRCSQEMPHLQNNDQLNCLSSVYYFVYFIL